MCGICGLLAPSGTADPALVARMNEALVHRGPDEGSVDAFGRCVLGHRRLQVIDLATGSQPVTSEDGRIVAVFNGELYNFPELRAGLAAAGHDVRGTGDTPVIPHLYEEYGVDFVGRLEGMFALALWDASSERLVLARDRLGKKPLLWTELPDGALAFASELKGLLRLPGLRREVDPPAIDAYLALQYVPGERTALVGVRKLLAGHILVAEGGRVETHAYWRAEPRPEARSDAEWLELIRETVRGAVTRRLIADVPLGALLSGGIDSSVVVALMAEASSAPVRTFTVGFGEPRYDERPYARAVAERYGTEHEELVVEPHAVELLPRLAWAFDEPLGDEAALPLFLICEAARTRVTVALTGDGGDEAFAGYERYVAHGLAGTPGLRLAPARLLRSLGRDDPRSTPYRLARLVEAARTPSEERYGRLVEVFPRELRAELFEPDFLAAVEPASALLGRPRAAGIRGLQLLDVETYLPGDLLLKADIASMASSLELRSPLLDHRVVELGIALPDSLRTRGRRGKEALRRAFADVLPTSVLERSKKGFGVPLARWFRGELRPLAGDLLLDERARRRGQLRTAVVKRLLEEHSSGRADHGHRLWSLVMLELWQRFYVESEQPPLTADRAEREFARA
jgi:asparagine synthase (glutamine-hydrolysing)